MAQTRSGDTFSRADLREVAIRQKVILMCVLVYLLAIALQFVVPHERRAIPAIASLGAGVIGAVFVFLLAVKLYGTGTGAALGILTVIPLIGLIMLLVVNAKATNVLKGHGISVGLLGASTADVNDSQPHDGQRPPPLP